MQTYAEVFIEVFINGFCAYASYLGREIIHPHWGNYFYWLIGISLLFWSLEILFPWRKKQSIIRKHFYLDAFYMFFNFFLFSLIGYNAISDVCVKLFNDFLRNVLHIENLVAISVASFPYALQLFVLFIIRDFIQFNIHRLLHRVPFLWEFHKIHHSVEQMGFAAHLRFHWMESIVYRSLEYIPLAMIGFGIKDFILVHLFTLSLGHFNHSNTRLHIGFLKYIFNNPRMHIWHHAKHLPHKYGVNFGLSLSIWDYLFKTAYIPKDGKNEPLGVENQSQIPKWICATGFIPF